MTLLSHGTVRMSEFRTNHVAYEHTRVTRSDHGSEFVCRAENAETKDKPKQTNAIINVACKFRLSCEIQLVCFFFLFILAFLID